MIVRLWSARTTQAKSRTYLQHFSGAVLPTLRKFDGYVSCTVLTRPGSNETEILVITVWQSFSAIDAFAGPDREAAALLSDFDRRVRHFEVAATDGLSFG